MEEESHGHQQLVDLLVIGQGGQAIAGFGTGVIDGVPERGNQEDEAEAPFRNQPKCNMPRC